MRSVVWRNLAAHGADYCSLWQISRGWLLRGTVITTLKDRRPMAADYEIECDDLWRTRRVAAACLMGSASRSLEIKVNASGAWSSWEEEYPALRECTDIDLEVTPATNTLPIRRLKLEVGESQEVSAAWLRFPDLTLEILRQRYTCLDPQRYLYQSASGFSAELRVDDLGLVISYPGGWERAATL